MSEDEEYAAYLRSMSFVPEKTLTREQFDEVARRAREWEKTRGGFFACLSKGTHWMPKDSERAVPLESLSRKHLENILAWLDRNKVRLKMSYEFNLLRGPLPSGDLACDTFEAGMTQLHDQPDDEWFNELPTVVTIRRLLNPPRRKRTRGKV